MTATMDDPLIAGMTIARTLPLHESSRRLRELYPECPRVYGVAVMSDLTPRRWWPLHKALSTDVSGNAIPTGSMWHIVGAAVVGAATHVPLLARSSELTSMRRAQAVLEALVGFGLPVRGGGRPRERKGLLN